MRWIVRSSLRFRFLVAALAAGLLFFGIGAVRAMPVDVFPEFAPPRVEVQTPCLGLSSSEVESLVTVPLEQTFAGMDGLDVLRSKSVSQLSSIELIFKQGTSLLKDRQLVQERVALVSPTLPRWAANPSMMAPVSATGRIMKIGLTSKKMSLIDLSMVAWWTIRARLLRVRGVANVAVWGDRWQLLIVQIDPEKLARQGVTLSQVMTETSDSLDVGLLQYANGAVVGTGGFVETAARRFGVRHILPILSPADLGKIVFTKPDGHLVRLRDVATMIEDNQPLIGDAIINDQTGVMLVVEKLPGMNSLEVTRGVDEALQQMKPGLSGIEIDPTIFRPATFIETAIHNLSSAMLLGVLLVLMILLLFLFEWRTAVISIVAIPLSLIVAGVVLAARGATINTMVLAGLVIAVGVVVDDAIIDVENIVRRLREARAAGSVTSTPRIILEASLEVRGAIIHATLIDAMALLPVFFMQGVSGSFFRPLATSYALAVIASMGVALTVTPALAYMLLARAPLKGRGSPVVRMLQRGYHHALSRIVARPLPAILTVGAVLIAGVTVAPTLGQSLYPEFKERDFLMHWITAPGTSLDETKRIVSRVGADLRAIPGVRNFGSHIGQATLGDEVVGVNLAENWISIDPSADYDKTLSAIRNVVGAYPGLQKDVVTYLSERIDEVLVGASESIVVRIYGPELSVLRSKAAEVKTILSGIEGVIDAHSELETDVPQVDITVNLAAAKRYGLKPGDVRRAAGFLLAGEEIGDLYRDGKAYDVQIWAKPSSRLSVSGIRDLLIDTPSGVHVRLGAVASVQINPVPNAIKREGASRRIDVAANSSQGDLGGVVAQLRKRLLAVRFPAGYHAEVLGQYAERQAAQHRLLGFMLIALVGVLFILRAAFKRWSLALMSFATLPSALVGGVIAIRIGGGIVSLGALIGFLTVLGIAARNGIMLINHFQHLEREEGEVFGPQLVLRGARERLAPIMMTALATALAVVPLVAAGSIPGHEIEYPMSVVIIGGLVTSTLLNLFIVPSLYLRFGRTPPTGAPPVQPVQT